MSQEFNDYRSAALTHVSNKAGPQDAWRSVYDWYKGNGRNDFMDAFTKETGLTFSRRVSPDDLVAMAIPKTYGDLENKVKDDAFYRAHSAWFLQEMDYILASVPRDARDATDAASFAGVLKFTNKVLLDSIVLFDDWGQYRAGVPGVYGINKNLSEHVVALYHGARQTIYDHGSWGLSFTDNHSDTATATIRQVLEIRLRRAFGVQGKLRKSDDAIYPIPLSDLLDAIDVHKQDIAFPIRFENIKRINGWANIYIHSGFKLYAWCPPRVLAFLREFLLGKSAPGYKHHSNAGVAMGLTAFDAVRDLIKKQHESPTFDVPLTDTSDCDVILQ